MDLQPRKMTFESDDGSIEVDVAICDEAPGADFSALLASQAAIEDAKRRMEDEGGPPAPE